MTMAVWRSGVHSSVKSTAKPSGKCTPLSCSGEGNKRSNCVAQSHANDIQGVDLQMDIASDIAHAFDRGFREGWREYIFGPMAEKIWRHELVASTSKDVESEGVHDPIMVVWCWKCLNEWASEAAITMVAGSVTKRARGARSVREQRAVASCSSP